VEQVLHKVISNHVSLSPLYLYSTKVYLTQWDQRKPFRKHTIILQHKLGNIHLIKHLHIHVFT